MAELDIGIRHVANIITDNVTEKKYFMSFFEGLWDDSCPYERTRKVKFYIFPDKMEIEKKPTPEYANWFKEQGFPPVLFEFKEYEDIEERTRLALIGEYAKEGFSESETEPIFNYIENAINFDEWNALLNINEILSSTVSRSDI